MFLVGSYLIARSLTLELDGPESLRVAARDILGHIVRNRIPITAALGLVQLKRAGTIVNTIAGIDEGVDAVGRNADLGATSNSSRVGGKLLIVEERRDSVVSAVALGACEGVEIEDAAVATVQSKNVS
jgi:hypothetical protein